MIKRWTINFPSEFVVSGFDDSLWKKLKEIFHNHEKIKMRIKTSDLKQHLGIAIITKLEEKAKCRKAHFRFINRIKESNLKKSKT